MRVLRRDALDGVRAALCAAGVLAEGRTLSAPEMAEALGIDLGRLQYLEKRGELPREPRTSQGHAAYRDEDVARYRAALDALADEDPVAEANAEGWVTRAQAAEMLGISLRELGRRVKRGELVAHEERIRGRVRVVFWGADVEALQ